MKLLYAGLYMILFTLPALLRGQASCNTCNNFIFKENKGQWEQQVRFKAEVKNGAIFFEKQGITFNLFDTRDVIRIKGDHHRLETYRHDIDYTMHFHALRLIFDNASQVVQTKGGEAVKEYYNYFIGSDKSKWASAVHGFRQITYTGIYDGIDLQVSTRESSLKYVYVLKPGAGAAQIRVRLEGADTVTVADNGDLHIRLSFTELVDLKPYAYQLVNGKEKNVACKFKWQNNALTYEFPEGYDKKQMLYLDPTLIFSTYSGSTADNFGYSATYDSKGNAFGAGSVFGVGYPVTTGAYQMNYVGGPTIVFTGGGTYPGDDISITKYTADGTQRIYSTYLGGYGQDLPHSLIANAHDELYILGTTTCSNYPVTATAFDTTFNGGNDPGVFDGIAAHYLNGSDIVISRLSVDGTQLLSSTYVGGSDNDGLNYRAGQAYTAPGFLRHNYADEVRGEIDIDKDNNVYVASCTRSANFPRTAGTFQNNFGGGMDACVFKMDASLTTMVWSTTFGGSDDDASYSVSIDNNADLYLAGGTRSPNFPVTNGTIQNAFAGGEADGFIIHIDKNGQQKIASTYYGYNQYDQVYFVELDKSNNVYVLGQADNAQSNFIKNAVYNKPNGGEFVTKFSPLLDSVIWSTSFGRGLGVTDISPTAFLVDVCNSIYACGWGSQGVNNIVGGTGGTTGLDVTPGAYKTTTDGQDFYLMVLKDDASALQYATFMGGGISEEHVDGGTSRFDKKGVCYESVCAGCGSNDDFPTTPGAVSNINRSNNCNNAVFKFSLDLPLCLADFAAPNACQNASVTFTNQSAAFSTPSYQWFFGDGGTSSQANPSHTYTQNGVFDVTLVVTDPGSCNFSDTLTKSILVFGGGTTDTLPTLGVCNTQTVQIGIPPINDSTVTYQWSPAGTLSAPNLSNPTAFPTVTTTYRLTVTNGLCSSFFIQTVAILHDTLHIQGNDVLCAGDTLTLTVNNTLPNQQFTYNWQPAQQIISGNNTANPVISPSVNTTYIVTGTNQAGCVYTDSIKINITSSLPSVNALAVPDTISYGDSSQLNLTLSNTVTAFNWRPDTSLSATDVVDPYAYPGQTHTYYVQVSDSQGCMKTDSVVVYVLRTPCAETNIYIPNAFSPNGDAKNDVLYVRSNNTTAIYFAVYDRWGQKVFETKDLNKGWDGQYKGKKLDPAVFGYYAEGTCAGGEKFFKKGNVTLLR